MGNKIGAKIKIIAEGSIKAPAISNQQSAISSTILTTNKNIHGCRPASNTSGLGSVSGFLGGLFGVGSAVIATPVLTMFFGATQVVAQGLSLAIAVPTTIATLATYSAHGQVDWLTGVQWPLVASLR